MSNIDNLTFISKTINDKKFYYIPYNKLNYPWLISVTNIYWDPALYNNNNNNNKLYISQPLLIEASGENIDISTNNFINLYSDTIFKQNLNICGEIIFNNVTINDISSNLNNLTLTGELKGPSNFIINPSPDNNQGIVRIKGGLIVDGSTTIINSTIVDISDKTILLASKALDATSTDGAGLEISGNKKILYDLSKDAFVTNISFETTHLKVNETIISKNIFAIDDNGNEIDITKIATEGTTVLQLQLDASFDDVDIAGKLHANDISCNTFNSSNIKFDNSSIALGYNAGTIDQSGSAIAIGYNAGYEEQGMEAIAIGNQSAYCDTTKSGAFGKYYTNQKRGGIAIGHYTARQGQGKYAINIGYDSGGYCVEYDDSDVDTNYSSEFNEHSISIGYEASKYRQHKQSIAIGKAAGRQGQLSNSIAIGTNSAYYDQTINCVAIGFKAGYEEQGKYSIAIGSNAGIHLGENSIAIGNQAAGSYNAYHIENSIILNATGNEFSPTISNGLYIAPIRKLDPTSKTSLLQYTASHEIVESSNININTIIAEAVDVDGNIMATGNITTTGALEAHANSATAASQIGSAKIGAVSGGTSDVYFSNAASHSPTDFGLRMSSGGQTVLNSKSGQNTYFTINNLSKMMIKSDGNVGINTTNPGEKLDVSGNIKATNFTTGTADDSASYFGRARVGGGGYEPPGYTSATFIHRSL